jgi:hypothetical protein
VENLIYVLGKTKGNKIRKRIEKIGSSISKNNVREKKQLLLVVLVLTLKLLMMM